LAFDTHDGYPSSNPHLSPAIISVEEDLPSSFLHQKPTAELAGFFFFFREARFFSSDLHPPFANVRAERSMKNVLLRSQSQP
jgi:hypothetical protein